MDLQIIGDDVQAVLNSDPMMALKVQNQALMRAANQLQSEVERLNKELEDCTTKAGKEKQNATSRT